MTERDWREVNVDDYLAYWRARREQERSERLARRARRQRLFGAVLVVALVTLTVTYLGAQLLILWLGGG